MTAQSTTLQEDQTMKRAPAWRRGWPSGQRGWVALAVIAALTVLVVPPMLLLLQGSITDVAADNTASFTTRHFTEMVSDREFLASAMNSVIFAVGSMVVALFIGWVNAWLVERTNAPLRGLSYLTTVISLGTPYVLYVTAWLLLLGKAGPINQLYRTLSGTSDILINVYSMTGMVLVEGFLWSPMAFLLVAATLRNANPELEEAARMSGASAGEVFRRITLRLSAPAIAALAMLIFIRAIEAFEVPALVGLPGRVYVLTTDIYNKVFAVAPPDLGGASAFSILLLAVVLVLLYYYGRLSKHADRFGTITGKSFRPRPFDLGRWRPLAGAAILLNFFLLLIVPMAMLIWTALLPFYQPVSLRAFKFLSLANFRTVLSSDHWDLAVNTIIVSVATATIAMTITSFGAWLAVRRQPGGWLIERLTTVPLVFPGLVLGVAVMQLFLRVPIPIYGTLGILVWAFVINYLPYGMRYSSSSMIQIHRELEETASVCGASPLTTLRRIVAPLLAPGLIAGWLFIFLMSSRVLSLAILLAGPRSQTMAVAMFDLWTNGQGTELAALGLIWSFAMAMVAILFYVLARRANVGIFNQA
jgi:iron(III) transport system permease protein